MNSHCFFVRRNFIKPLIGIILRPDKSLEGHDIHLLYDKFLYISKRLNFTCIGIPLTNSIKENKKLIDLCDGIIGQGGDDFLKKDISLIKYIYDKNIPFLGICLSMQAMGYLFSGELKEIKTLKNKQNHKDKKDYVHKIKIKKNTLLYKIVKKEVIEVNSRHKSTIINTKLNISAISKDNIVEAIEDTNKLFFLGLQWHPESLFDKDKFNYKICRYFVKVSGGKK